jgi:hypothetical protein
MTDQKLKHLVTHAVELDREIEEKQAELKAVKQTLIAEAESRPEEHSDTDGGGKSWTAEGTDGNVCRVSFPADSLKDKIAGEGKTIEKVKDFAGKFFNKLFQPSVSYTLVPNFRDEAKLLLGGSATKLIKLCQKESSPRVSFETKDKAE